jgi:flagellar biosynthetic protein FlhB
VAERIKEVAREHRIPIRENKPLAQALYKVVEVGQMIPEEMYQAVAQILAQLYQFKQSGPNR